MRCFFWGWRVGQVHDVSRADRADNTFNFFFLECLIGALHFKCERLANRQCSIPTKDDFGELPPARELHTVISKNIVLVATALIMDTIVVNFITVINRGSTPYIARYRLITGSCQPDTELHGVRSTCRVHCSSSQKHTGTGTTSVSKWHET